MTLVTSPKRVCSSGGERDFDCPVSSSDVRSRTRAACIVGIGQQCVLIIDHPQNGTAFVLQDASAGRSHMNTLTEDLRYGWRKTLGVSLAIGASGVLRSLLFRVHASDPADRK